MAEVKIRQLQNAGDYSTETSFEAKDVDYINENLIKNLFGREAAGQPERAVKLVDVQTSQPGAKHDVVAIYDNVGIPSIMHRFTKVTNKELFGGSDFKWVAEKRKQISLVDYMSDKKRGGNLIMDFKINRNDLLDGINIVSKAVATKSTMPILACILVTTEENSIRLYANNLELGIETAPIAADVKKQGSVALDGRIFLEIIKKVEGDTVSVSLGNKNRAIIKCEKSDYKIAYENSNDFPALPTIERVGSIALSQEALKRAIKQTLFSVSYNEDKPVFTGELFELLGNTLNIVAVDGFRIAYRKLNNELNESQNRLVIPGKTLTEIYKLLSSHEAEEIILYPQANHILFDLGNCMLVSRLIEGKFMDYTKALNADSKTSILINRAALAKGIERVAIIALEQKKTPVRLKFEDNKVSIFAQTGYGTCNEEVDIVKMQGEDGLEISFNPRYLMDALNAIEDETVKIHFGGSLQPAVILPPDGEAVYKYLILPLRVS